MTENQFKPFFYILLIGCLILIPILDKPIRDYIPIIWGFIGFGISAFLFWKTWLNLSEDLIDNHKKI